MVISEANCNGRMGILSLLLIRPVFHHHHHILFLKQTFITNTKYNHAARNTRSTYLRYDLPS